MKTKTVYGWSEKGLDKTIEEFISNEKIEVIDIKFSMHFLLFAAMVLYKEK